MKCHTGGLAAVAASKVKSSKLVKTAQEKKMSKVKSKLSKKYPNAEIKI